MRPTGGGGDGARPLHHEGVHRGAQEQRSQGGPGEGTTNWNFPFLRHGNVIIGQWKGP